MKVAVVLLTTVGADPKHDIVVDILVVAASRRAAITFLGEHFGPEWVNWGILPPTPKCPDTTWKNLGTNSFITLIEKEVLP